LRGTKQSNIQLIIKSIYYAQPLAGYSKHSNLCAAALGFFIVEDLYREAFTGAAFYCAA